MAGETVLYDISGDAEKNTLKITYNTTGPNTRLVSTYNSSPDTYPISTPILVQYKHRYLSIIIYPEICSIQFALLKH